MERAAVSPIADDPAARSNAMVWRIYRQDQLERAWPGGSAGTVYVLHPAGVPQPPHTAGATPNR